MKFRKVAVLTSSSSWFVPYAEALVAIIREKGLEASLFFDHRDIDGSFEIVLMLSYFKLVEKEFLAKHIHNIVVHESDLPRGRGWAPYFWQVLEGKRRIPVTLFDASEGTDNGPVYLRDFIDLDGCELHDELREAQANKTKELCVKFLEEYEGLRPLEQKGETTNYSRRTPEDGRIDSNKTIEEQFDLFRIAHNEEFPVFFEREGQKYFLKIYRDHRKDEKNKDKSR